MCDLNRVHHVPQVRANQHDICAFPSDGGTRSHGYSHVGASQGGSVINAVTHHSELMACGSLLVNGGKFLVWKQAGSYVINPEASGDYASRVFLVPGNHEGT